MCESQWPAGEAGDPSLTEIWPAELLLSCGQMCFAVMSRTDFGVTTPDWCAQQKEREGERVEGVREVQSQRQHGSALRVWMLEKREGLRDTHTHTEERYRWTWVCWRAAERLSGQLWMGLRRLLRDCRRNHAAAELPAALGPAPAAARALQRHKFPN